MRVNWRAGAITGAIAFLVSALAGMAGGVEFGRLVLRALVGGVVFASGGVGLVLLIDRFLPDLLVQPSPEGSGTAGRVDIVVDDDIEDESAFGPQEYRDDADGGDEFGGVADEGREAPDDDYDDDRAADDDPEELEEATADEGDSGALPDVGRFSDSFNDGPVDAVSDQGGESGSRSGEDPSMMARAIRTGLKREQ